MRGTLTWADQGAQVAVGLESYASGADVNKYTNSDLRYALNEGAFVIWAGYDNKLINGPKMCGGWNSAYSWRAAENSGEQRMLTQEPNHRTIAIHTTSGVSGMTRVNRIRDVGVASALSFFFALSLAGAVASHRRSIRPVRRSPQPRRRMRPTPPKRSAR